MLSGALRDGARRGIRSCFDLLFALLGLFLLSQRRRPAVSTHSPVSRLLVVRLDLLGDVMLSRPAVLALRRAFPGARLSMLVLPYTAPLVELWPEIDEVVTADTNRIRRPAGLLSLGTWIAYWHTVRRLRNSHFDLCVSLYGRMGSLWALLSGARQTVGYQDEQYRGLLTAPVSGGRYAERQHEADYAAALAPRVGDPVPASNPGLPVTEQASRSAYQLLCRHDIDASDPLILIHAGSINGSAKRWPAPLWAEFADSMSALLGSHTVLVGAAADRSVAESVLAQARRPITSVVGETDIHTLVGLISRARLVASGDSGPLHLAVALRRPVLGVYGPNDPAISGPYQPVAPARVLRRDLPCSPCYTLSRSAECPLGDPICMRLVTVPDMVAAARELLTDCREEGGKIHGGSRNDQS